MTEPFILSVVSLTQSASWEIDGISQLSVLAEQVEQVRDCRDAVVSQNRDSFSLGLSSKWHTEAKTTEHCIEAVILLHKPNCQALAAPLDDIFYDNRNLERLLVETFDLNLA